MSRYKIIGAPWNIPGAKNVEDCVTSEEVMIKAKLNYTVDKCELVAKMPFKEENADAILDEVNEGKAFLNGTNVFRNCPNTYATYRTDVNIPLGNVKSKYEVVQNISAFNFFDGAIGKDKAIWQTAGYFGNGERIFVSAKLPDNITVKGDKIENYLVFANSHDGTSGVNILFTPIRVICQNTLNAAIRNAESFIRFRHTASVNSKLLSAAEILGISKQKAIVAEQMFNAMTDVKFDDKSTMEYIASIYLTDAEFERVKSIDEKSGINRLFTRSGQLIQDAQISTRKVNMLYDTFNYYIDGPGQAEFRGTAYGAYNAITGYYSNIANLQGDKRLDSLLYGNAAKVTQTAVEALFEY